MRTRHFLAVLACGIIVLGCATATPYTKPERLSAGFDPRTIADVAVVPVLDMRVDKSEALKLDASVHQVVKQLMPKRGYKVTTFADRSLIGAFDGLTSRDTLEPMVKDFTAPDAPRYVLVFGLVDAYSKMTFGSTGNAEMFGYMVDQQLHEVVWYNKAIGQFGQGGLMGMAMKGFMTSVAIETATQNLVHSIPPREEKK